MIYLIAVANVAQDEVEVEEAPARAVVRLVLVGHAEVSETWLGAPHQLVQVVAVRILVVVDRLFAARLLVAIRVVVVRVQHLEFQLEHRVCLVFNFNNYIYYQRLSETRDRQTTANNAYPND